MRELPIWAAVYVVAYAVDCIIDAGIGQPIQYTRNAALALAAPVGWMVGGLSFRRRRPAA